MNLFKISWSNLKGNPLSTAISLMLLTMGVAIISMLLLLNTQLEENFTKNIRGIDMVVGAKGSPLQLILSSVYHIDNPTGNIPLATADSLLKHPLIEKGIPLAYGDNYNGYRILGTSQEYKDHYEATLAEGAWWKDAFEVTLGATVAERLDLKVGDAFFGSHGLVGDLNAHESHPYTVVGICVKSQTVVDQLIMTGLESVWEIHAHEEVSGAGGPDSEGEHEESAHEEDREITAMLVKFRSPMGTVMLPRLVNEQTVMQAALPAIEINRLFGLFAVGISTIRGIALAIIVISGISVFISLYNSLKERQYELALMRTLGASQGKVFTLVMLEGLMLAGLGFVMGMIVSRLGMFLLSNAVISDYHYDFSGFFVLKEEAGLLMVTLLIGFLAALLPASQAFRTDISETLANA